METARLIFLALLSGLIQTQENGNIYQRICFIDNSAQYRQYEGQFDPTTYAASDSSLTDPPGLCTHIVYTYAAIDTDNLGLMPAGDYEENNYQTLASLKALDPQLKVILGVGGPSAISDGFTEIINSTETIEEFVKNAAQFLIDRNFDGIMLDWMYPGLGNSPAEDVDSYPLLVEAMLRYFTGASESTGDNSRLMVMVAVSGDKSTVDDSYRVQTLAENADYILVKAYDFYTAEISILGHHSALYSRQEEQGYLGVLNADFAVQYLLYLGVPQSKLILGVSTHGRTFKFANTSDDTQKFFGFEHGGAGEPGPYTQAAGLLAFYEVCGFLASGWTSEYNYEHQVPYAYSDAEMITYDDMQSVIEKINYVKDSKLGGVFISSLADDDFSGTFCGQGPYPLTQAVKAALALARENCPPGTYGAVDERGCFPCPKGSYQPESAQTACLPCPEGLTTPDTGADAIDKCMVDCPSGHEFSQVRQQCRLCPLGFVRDPQQHRVCEKCTQGFTTVASGSQACVLRPVDCPSGHEFSQVRQQCRLCPLGFVRDPQQHRVCEKCTQGFTTVASGSQACVLRPADLQEESTNQINVETTLLFDVISCENKPVIEGAINQMISMFFKVLTEQWPGLCHPDCTNVHSEMVSGCGDGDHLKSKHKGRYRRYGTAHNQQPTEDYSLEVQASAMNVPENLNDSSIVRKTESVIEEALFAEDVFIELKTYGIIYKGVSSLSANILCEDGSVLLNNSCKHQTDTGLIAGASVGAVIGFLILILIIISCMACIKFSKVKKRSMDFGRRNDIQGPSPSNHYASGSARGVKFVDYIDYYAWMFAPPSNQSEYANCPPRISSTGRATHPRVHRNAPPRRHQSAPMSRPAKMAIYANPLPVVPTSTVSRAANNGTSNLNGHASLNKSAAADSDSFKTNSEMIY
ncbi:chitinase-3-like protein 1 [Plakobranchus ocellatus]|uniref:Chitinase-3-like protein 1 n=1 Tax=Plakobranchus ocellatus TaxID=259542 RepID=A0AAV4D4Q7_9GAST|nr:chitinase-3-like protein 1 [Plakobranchus ocellatus]